jgi:hypothetical protein
VALPTKPPVPVASTIIMSAAGRPVTAHDCFAATTSSGMYAFCAGVIASSLAHQDVGEGIRQMMAVPMSSHRC